MYSDPMGDAQSTLQGYSTDPTGTLGAQGNPQAGRRQCLGNTRAIPLESNTHSGSTLQSFKTRQWHPARVQLQVPDFFPPFFPTIEMKREKIDLFSHHLVAALKQIAGWQTAKSQAFGKEITLQTLQNGLINTICTVMHINSHNYAHVFSP